MNKLEACEIYRPEPKVRVIRTLVELVHFAFPVKTDIFLTNCKENLNESVIKK